MASYSCICRSFSNASCTLSYLTWCWRGWRRGHSLILKIEGFSLFTLSCDGRWECNSPSCILLALLGLRYGDQRQEVARKPCPHAYLADRKGIQWITQVSSSWYCLWACCGLNGALTACLGSPANTECFGGLYFRLWLKFHRLLWPEDLFSISKT